MGVPFYENEDMFSDEDGNTCCCCSCSQTTCSSSSSAKTTTNTKSTTPLGQTDTSSASASASSNVYISKAAYKDIVGNCKEVRIEENTSNLRIVGNNNRIRIAINTGDLIVIGNNTRLKIKNNQGHIKYTGNDGRISLGSDSLQQLVDYLGSNGTLKIIKHNSMKFAKENCNSKKTENCNKNKATLNRNCHEQQPTHVQLKSDHNHHNKCNIKSFVGNSNLKTTTAATAASRQTTNNTTASAKTKDKKSHSYGGSSCNQWQQFTALFNEAQKSSMPNLNSIPYETLSYCKPEATNIVQNIGNIVIANASNVCISPFTTRNIIGKA